MKKFWIIKNNNKIETFFDKPVETSIECVIDLNKVYTTIGVYPNGNFKTNGVIGSNLLEHIKYNVRYRFGRALIVDGIIVYTGYFNITELIEYYQEKLQNITRKEDSMPYH